MDNAGKLVWELLALLGVVFATGMGIGYVIGAM